MTPLRWRWYFWRYGRGDTRKKAENQYQEIIKELALFWHSNKFFPRFEKKYAKRITRK